ncbi:MAG: CRISPR-associated endonuclease Cas1 [Candidatus Micrarchaeota archaeon]|nr:MAG: CRISPR-associated endonuclease Cas1 [Candidatus Micrarchaeota archaeon]
MSKKNLYIFKDGAIRLKNTTLYLITKEEKIPLQIEQIRSIYFIGSGSISTKVLQRFKELGILIHFYDRFGNYIGTFYPKDNLISGEILLRQAKAAIDINSRLRFAKLFVTGAMKNINWILDRFGLDQLEIKDISNISNINELMQAEGLFRRMFYDKLDSKLPDEFKIVKREMHPPSNRGNALLSFLNSLVYNLVTTEIYYTHLNPSISYLHEPFERRFSLSLDVAEIFKPLLSERLILRLCDLKQLDPVADFEDNEGLFLSKLGLKKVVKAFDDEISKTIQFRTKNKNVTIRQLVRIELYKIEKDLLGIKEYKPLVCWW